MNKTLFLTLAFVATDMVHNSNFAKNSKNNHYYYYSLFVITVKHCDQMITNDNCLNYRAPLV